MGLPHLFVALGAQGRAAPEESGSEPAAVSGDLMTSLRAKQPRRSGSQLWRLSDALVESWGLSRPWCKKGLTGTPRSWGSNSGSLRHRVLLGLCNHWPFLGEGAGAARLGRISRERRPEPVAVLWAELIRVE